MAFLLPSRAAGAPCLLVAPLVVLASFCVAGATWGVRAGVRAWTAFRIRLTAVLRSVNFLTGFRLSPCANRTAPDARFLYPLTFMPHSLCLALLGALAAVPMAFSQTSTQKPGGAVHAPVSAAPAGGLLAVAAETLQPGEFLWQPEASPSGPVLVVVSIPEQRAYVYRNGVSIGISTVSTGRKGHETPTGVFTILQKEEKHFSKTYNNAPMPFMERLTWDGIALHAGNLPGYPASHGCVRLPKEFARLLYGVTSKGLSVVIAGDAHDSQTLVHPGLLAPVAADARTPADPDALPAGGFTWKPERAAAGPMSILLSGADRTIYVYRGGAEIGRARVRLANPEQPLGYAVYNMMEGFAQERSPIAPDLPSHRWLRVNLREDGAGATTSTVAARVRLPAAFSQAVYSALEPGTTLLVTDLAAGRKTQTKPGFVVIVGDGS